MSGAQNSEVLAWLRAQRTITPLEALENLGCFRLGARIYDLRQEGHVIDRELIEVRRRDGSKARVAKYRLIEEAKQAA